MTPTTWYLNSDPLIPNGRPIAAARSYWPASTLVEVWNPYSREWRESPILTALSEEPDWQETTDQAVNDWIHSFR